MVGVPQETGRLDIMQRHFADVPHDFSPSDLRELAAVTHGYVGADLKALCREAALHALQRSTQGDPLNMLTITRMSVNFMGRCGRSRIASDRSRPEGDRIWLLSLSENDNSTGYPLSDPAPCVRSW